MLVVLNWMNLLRNVVNVNKYITVRLLVKKKDWKRHKIECTIAKKEHVDLKDVVFMLGHSFIKDEVFRLPDDVNILTYSKCGESLVSAISMDKCDTLDRCEIGTKPHLYRGSRNNVINNMYFNFEPRMKYTISGILFEDRIEYPIVGFKMNHEETDTELMGFRDDEISSNSIYSKFHFYTLTPEFQMIFEREMKNIEKKFPRINRMKLKN